MESTTTSGAQRLFTAGLEDELSYSKVGQAIAYRLQQMLQGQMLDEWNRAVFCHRSSGSDELSEFLLREFPNFFEVIPCERWNEFLGGIHDFMVSEGVKH